MTPLAFPDRWTVTTLADVCTIERGVTFPATVKTKQPAAGTVACLRTANVQERVDWQDLIYIPRPFVKTESKYVRRGDILISMANSLELVGKVAFVDQVPIESTLGGFISVIRATRGVTPQFLFHYLKVRAVQESLRSTASRSVNIANLSLGRVYGIQIALPPIEEQNRIVAKLEALLHEARRTREALQRIPPLVKRFRQSVLAAAFRGQLVPQDPRDEPAAALLERIRAERRQQWAAQGKDPARYAEPAPPDAARLGELPAGWVWTTVNEVAQSIQYGYTATSSPDMSGPCYLRITDIQGGEVDWSTVPRCEIAPDAVQKYLLDPGDIVFARSGATAGKSFLIGVCPCAVFASYLIRVKLSQGVLPDYLYGFFGSDSYWDQVITRGNAQPNANARVLGRIRFPLAPLTEQRRIVARIEALFAQADAVEAAAARGLRRVEQFEQSALARAFRGEV
jgi:type I restriction enzyme S subunit